MHTSVDVLSSKGEWVKSKCLKQTFSSNSIFLEYFSDCSSSGTGCSNAGPLLDHESHSKHAPVWNPLSMAPCILPEAQSRVCIPRRQSLFWAPICSSMGPFRGSRRFPMDIHRRQGHSCLPMVLTMGCRGISALVPEAPPPFLLHWPWCLQSYCPHILPTMADGLILELPENGSVGHGEACGSFSEGQLL